MMPLTPLVNAVSCLRWLLAVLCVLGGSAWALPCVQPPAGLVSWWPGDGNADDIIGSNDGALQGGTTFAPGMVGQAFSLDGVDDSIRVPNHPSLNPARALTIEAWIHSASTEGARDIVSKWNDDTGEWSYIFKDHNDSDKLRIELSESIHNDLADLEGSTSIPLGTWVHVATTYDAGEGTVRLYFNGIEDAFLAIGPGRFIDSSLTDLLIGAVFTGGGIFENFAGLIDEVTIYNRALSAQEIQAIFNAGSAGKCKDTKVNVNDRVTFEPIESTFRFTPDPSGCPSGMEHPVLSYLSAGYRFLIVPFGEGSGFEQPAFDDSHFAVGNAAFGTGDFCPLDPTVQTSWPLETDILLRKTFTLPANATAVEVAVAIDNDVQVFINGVDISGGIQQNEGCAERDRFIFSVPDSLLIFGGDNLLAVRARDRGVISYVDVEIRAVIADIFVGTFSFEARLTNTSASSLSHLVVEVTELTHGNLLQNANGGPGGVGAHLTVPEQDGLTDGILSPNEFVDVPFLICLTKREPFTFLVDVLGVEETSTEAHGRTRPMTDRRAQRSALAKTSWLVVTFDTAGELLRGRC
jgi:hypothetical protein